eukprot:CAMPEP_0201994354 /NCGR_PEP_ID=MMETSP0905-20130828/2221_1 /ASSEMBLY_ACC=CAM_ASM_000554 /TAXON_ID=420261 /ORGANISM="Thalassiosira antarctica, Strain CCMP982" /LENGTH=330 /DNA_ID=CAMNT_0048549307 /DNA_START=66 /DNA_END=1055 /DNA_ORIENTATION=-
MTNFPRRLWSTGSKPKKSKVKMPYPQEIRIENNDVFDSKLHRRHSREEMKFWKEKALTLEDALEKLEEKVTALENASIGGDGCGGSPASSFKSVEPSMGGASPSLMASFTSSSPGATASPSSSGKTGGEQVKQRKDEIMQQLVSEMERLIELHASKIVEEDNEDGDEDADESAHNASDGTDLPARTQRMKIETSTLEELLTRVLSTEKDTSAPPETESEKPKSHKHKQRRALLYQLSCKHCIGQNFVGSTKNNLKDKVKENYAVVWQVVQTAYGKGEGDVGGEDLEHGLSFRASSFAHHAARHCQDCESEGEVNQWCLENVKVERISKHS